MKKLIKKKTNFKNTLLGLKRIKCESENKILIIFELSIGNHR